MKINTWLKYFAYTFIIIAIMCLGQYVLVYLKKLREVSFNLYVYETNLITFIFCATIGFLIGLEYFLKEKRKEGRWRINLPKLLLMGLPSLYFSLYAFIFYAPVPFIRNIVTRSIEFFISGNMTLTPIFQLLFGYVVITSLYKVLDE